MDNDYVTQAGASRLLAESAQRRERIDRAVAAAHQVVAARPSADGVDPASVWREIDRTDRNVALEVVRLDSVGTNVVRDSMKRLGLL